MILYMHVQNGNRLYEYFTHGAILQSVFPMYNIEVLPVVVFTLLNT